MSQTAGKPIKAHKRKRNWRRTGEPRQAKRQQKLSLRAKNSIPLGPSRWYWLLASDGSPSRGIATTAPEAATKKATSGNTVKCEDNEDDDQDEDHDWNGSDKDENDEDASAFSDDGTNKTNKSTCRTTSRATNTNTKANTKANTSVCLDVPWMDMFRLLCIYKEQHKGSIDVPIYKVSSEQTLLGNWVYEQRLAHKKGRLSNERLNLLESIGMRFMEKNPYDWMSMYQRLLQHKEKYNNVQVPSPWEIDPTLSSWVKRQREGCKKVSQRRLLTKIGFEFEPIRDIEWMAMYQKLAAYKEKHGDTLVPWKDRKLFYWVKRQREGCKKVSQRRLLTKIGFEFEPIRDIVWMAMYQKLAAYKEKHGDTQVPWKDRKLSCWVKRQREGCKKVSQRRLLTKIGFEFEPIRDIVWMAMYQKLAAYKEKHGDTRVPWKTESDRKLFAWTTHQRNACKDKDRINLLDELDFVWQPRLDNWFEMYERLVAFQKKYGTANVPPNWEEDPKLAKWVIRQRRHRDRKQCDLLNDVGFVWDVNERLKK